jgi:hypothetical protein
MRLGSVSIVLRSELPFGVSRAMALGAVLLVIPVGAAAQPIDSLTVAGLRWRTIGPAHSGGRLSDVVGIPGPSKTLFVAAAAGGVWKTSNNGITWNPISDSVDAAAVGAVAVAPSNSQIVWMGTGANDMARSSYSGKGRFKSTDAGKTWSFAGLPDSHHIARIAIHPTNPDIVYVAVLGHLFSRNEERGVFRTMNGGRTWEKVLYLGDGIAAVDVLINRQSPSILYATMYEKQRLPWQLIESGPGSGLYRSDDGGAHWTKLEGGLPTGKIGRIGIDIYQKNPNILYALLENQNPKPGTGSRYGTACGPRPAAKFATEL